jgi:hypothetical protein
VRNLFGADDSESGGGLMPLSFARTGILDELQACKGSKSCLGVRAPRRHPVGFNVTSRSKICPCDLCLWSLMIASAYTQACRRTSGEDADKEGKTDVRELFRRSWSTTTVLSHALIAIPASPCLKTRHSLVHDGRDVGKYVG